MGHPAPIVFLFDVDNTLLDSDRFHGDLGRYLVDGFGTAAAERYWALYEALRVKLGYADYLGAIQQFRLTCDDEIAVQHLAGWVLEYPFADLLYPHALDVIAHLSGYGPCVVLSDGDVVLQPHKIQRAGITQAVAGRVLIYVHKERMLQDVARQFPAAHYVMVEDKLRVLDSMQRQWQARLTTVFVRQGHYANDIATQRAYPRAQIELAAIAGLGALTTNDFLAVSLFQSANATE